MVTTSYYLKNNDNKRKLQKFPHLYGRSRRILENIKRDTSESWSNELTHIHDCEKWTFKRSNIAKPEGRQRVFSKHLLATVSQGICQKVNKVILQFTQT